MTKKAISPVISTVLLILIGITAVVVIATVLIPFIRDMLDESKECFEIMDQVTINTESGYTCYYNETATYTVNITIKRGPKETNIDRFKIGVHGAGTSNVFDIKTGESGVRMLDGSTTIVIPVPGAEETYSLTTNLNEVTYAEVSPVLEGGGMCDATPGAELERCYTGT